ncbi:hypothetical protein V9T40_011508 [Parthenolecanium corni]|uniref:Uncharacterized protein n=1 Tax=Parthenolecanium corni TaxID=536013 RepID=A0AAN9XYH4_9HEMI
MSIKLAFLIILVAAIHQTCVFSAPVDSDFAFSPIFDIIGKAATDIFKSADELAQSIASIVVKHGKHVVVKHLKLIRASILNSHLMVIASGSFHYFEKDDDFGHENRRMYRIAKSVEEMASRLDTMEAAYKLIFQTGYETANQIPERDLLSKEIVGLKLFFDSLDRNFQNAEGLREMYQKLLEKHEKEPLPKMTGLEDLKKQTDKQMKMIVNFYFVILAFSPPTVLLREQFILARSTVQLAKLDVNTFDQVQRIYEKTLEEQAAVLIQDMENKDTLKIFKDMIFIYDSIVSALKKNLEKHPSINKEWQVIQKDVSQRTDWDQSFWDWYIED